MPKLQKTSAYGKFKFMRGQRPIDLNCSESKTLMASMKEYGFLPAFPVMVRATGSGDTYEIVDGQHRYTVAKELGLPIYYVVDESEIDVTLVNKAQRKWSPTDFAESYAAKDIDAYQTLIDYHRSFQIAITLSAAILSGTSNFGNIRARFFSGRFTVKNAVVATNIGMVYREAGRITAAVKKAAFVDALWACYAVGYFNPDQLLEGITKKPYAMRVGSRRDDFLTAMEEVYNYGRKTRKPLKFDAEQAMMLRKKNFSI